MPNILKTLAFGFLSICSSLPTARNAGSAKTSGWTEETRNHFHPGAIMTVIDQFVGYAPSLSIEPIEFACHYLGEGREFPQPYISDYGVIEGFFYNFIPRIESISTEVRENFPELAEYIDELTPAPDFEKRFENEETRFALIAQIEARFGTTIEVLPKNVKAQGKEKVETSQAQLMAKLAARGVTMIGAVLPSQASADAAAPSECTL